MGSLEFAKLLVDAKVAVSPGIGFGNYDDRVRFALIENEQRIRRRSAASGMFRKDGLIRIAA